MSGISNEERELLLRAAKERSDIVYKYDKGREDGAQIDPWEDPAFEVYHVTDRYGFIHNKALPHGRDAAENKAKAIELERTQKWVKMMKNWDKYFPGEKLRRRVYKGIPDAVRGEIWCRILDLNRIKMEQPGVYEEMKERARQLSPDVRQIDLDVNRTYRDHIMFRKRYDVKQQALFHVLAAYSMYNTEVGYCQGMSQIAALLLMYMNEEEAFWGMSALLSNRRHAMHGFFIPGFPKLMRFQAHHDRILQKMMPKVKKHMEKNDLFANIYTIKWFLQCFLDRVPFNLTLRLWDVYMLDGEKVLTAMAYTIFKMHKKKILRMQQDELLAFFQNGLEKNFGYDDDQVIESLGNNIEELRKANLIFAPKKEGDQSELPQKPFGLFVPPSVEQIIGRRTIETEKEIVSGKRRSIAQLRPQIPADGGPAAIPQDEAASPEKASRNSTLGDYDALPITSVEEPSSVVDSSDMTSSNTTASRHQTAHSSRNTLNEPEPVKSASQSSIIAVGPAEAAQHQERESDYDNVNGMYEQDLERTLENIEAQNMVSYTQGVSVVGVNGYTENLTKHTHQVELHHYETRSESSHVETSNSRTEETRFSSSTHVNGPIMTLPLNGVNGIQNGYIEPTNHVSPTKTGSPVRISPSRSGSSGHRTPMHISPTGMSPSHISPSRNSPGAPVGMAVSPTRRSPHAVSPVRTSPNKMSPTRVSPTKKSPTRMSPNKMSPTRGSPTKSPTRATPPGVSPVRTPNQMSPTRNIASPTRSGSRSPLHPRSPPGPMSPVDGPPPGEAVYRSTVYL